MGHGLCRKPDSRSKKYGEKKELIVSYQLDAYAAVAAFYFT